MHFFWEPDGFKNYPVRPEAAFYSHDMREFLLSYEAVRRAANPDSMVLEFAHSTYEAAADRGGWDRRALEHVVSESQRRVQKKEEP